MKTVSRLGFRGLDWHCTCRSPLYLLISQGVSQSRIPKSWLAPVFRNQNGKAGTRPRAMKEPASSTHARLVS